jgi:uncharacterized protein Veg
MDLMKQSEVVGRIRNDLEAHAGKSFRMRANLGRSKIMERDCELIETHPSLFVLRLQEKRDRTARVSYSYVDILTGTVELSHSETGENLFPWLN